MTLTMATDDTLLWPVASSMAASVSTVSPDWVMASNQRPLVDDRVAVAKLGAVVHLDRHAGQIFSIMNLPTSPE